MTPDHDTLAFPHPHFGDTGMRLRDYFAAKAMQAMITKSHGQDKTGGAKGVPLIATYAYEFADAMMAERSKPDQNNDVKLTGEQG